MDLGKEKTTGDVQVCAFSALIPLLPWSLAAGGHAGYEMAPFIPSLEALVLLLVRGALRPSPALNTVQHHDMHHRNPKVHFSLYMTHWDRLMGTEHPEYTQRVDKHFNLLNK